MARYEKAKGALRGRVESAATQVQARRIRVTQAVKKAIQKMRSSGLFDPRGINSLIPWVAFHGDLEQRAMELATDPVFLERFPGDPETLDALTPFRMELDMSTDRDRSYYPTNLIELFFAYTLINQGFTTP